MSEQTKKTLWPIERLVNWKKNPRVIDEAGKKRLKDQLLRLGQYKPVIITEEGSFGVALGGNMRLVAMRELVAEGHAAFKEVWVSIVEAPDDETKLKYALSDNDRAGRYVEEDLVAMARGMEDFRLDSFHVDVSETVGMDTLIDRYDMADVRAQPVGAGEDVDRNTVKDAKEVFDNATIKQIVLYFGNDEYIKTLELLQRVTDANGLENNTEAAVKMFQFYEENHPSEGKED